MKQKNVKIMDRLAILLILSSLLIGSGLLTEFLYCDMEWVLSCFTTFVQNNIGPAIVLFVITFFPLVILLVAGLLFYVILFGSALVTAACSIGSAVLAVIASRKIRREAPEKQRAGRTLVIWAVILNLLAAVCLLLLNLVFFFLEFIAVYPWGLLSALLWISGSALSILSIVVYKKLQFLPGEGSDGIPEAWKDWRHRLQGQTEK